MNRNYGKDSITENRHYFKVAQAKTPSASFKKQWDGLTAYQRHEKLVRDYQQLYHRPKQDKPKYKPVTELEILRQNHEFLREEEEEEQSLEETWESRLAKKYYDKLFKEFCLAELSKYKQGKIAMRWRTETELKAGKGQFVCGNINCNDSEALKTWEVPFGYVEKQIKKMALVKLKLCDECSFKLNYKRNKEQPKKLKIEADAEKSLQDGQHEQPSDEQSSAQAQQIPRKDEETGQAIEQEKEWSAPLKHKQKKSGQDEELDSYLDDLFS